MPKIDGHSVLLKESPKPLTIEAFPPERQNKVEGPLSSEKNHEKTEMEAESSLKTSSSSPSELKPSEPKPIVLAPIHKTRPKIKFPPVSHFSTQASLKRLIKDRGIERSDRAASFLLFRAKEKLVTGEVDEAIRMAHLAEEISPSSPTPQFFLAKSYLEKDGWHFVTSVVHYLSGLELIVSDFPFLLPALGPFLILSFFAILLMMSFFILYSLLSHGPTWVHLIVELSKGFLQPIPSAFLFALLFLSPLLLGLPLFWFFLISFVLFWGQYRRLEKQIVSVFLVGVAFSAWLIPFSLTLFTAKGSPLLDEMSRNYQGDFFWTPPAVQVSDGSWEVLFIRATYASQQRDYQNAKKIYLSALKIRPGSPAILNNLGNQAFYMKDYDQALVYYEKALEIEPGLTSSRYNMGQAYREMLLFDKGEVQFAKAIAISTKTTETYASKTERYPDFPVIEEHFSKADLWRILLEERSESDLFSERIWRILAGSIPLKASLGIAIFWAILLAVSGTLHQRFFSAKQCSFCKTAICNKCIRRLFSFQICRGCEVRYMSIRRKSDYIMIEDAVKRVPYRLYPLFIIPGGGHLSIGKTKTACIYLLLFFLSLLSITIGDRLIPPTDWVLHYAGDLLPKLTIIVLYLSVTWSLYRGREGGAWL